MEAFVKYGHTKTNWTYLYLNVENKISKELFDIENICETYFANLGGESCGMRMGWGGGGGGGGVRLREHIGGFCGNMNNKPTSWPSSLLIPIF